MVHLLANGTLIEDPTAKPEPGFGEIIRNAGVSFACGVRTQHCVGLLPLGIVSVPCPSGNLFQERAPFRIQLFALGTLHADPLTESETGLDRPTRFPAPS
jgi:hypothetical protein